ncbi:MAG TPA: nitronate monooxygenase [Nocardioidaceae bacterium]|nr:nitronate monooxygenase [Nocardioidaceae bacterium]
MNAPDLTTRLGETVLPDPLLTASGCGGTGCELDPFLDMSTLAGFVTRTITLDASAGRPLPRVVTTPSGLLSAMGGQNPGLQGFLAAELPWLARRRVRTVVSIAGRTLGEYGELTRRVGQAPGVHGLEVNMATANSEARDRDFDTDPRQVAKVVNVVRRDAPRGVAVWAKLSPHSRLVDLARAAADEGADALVLVHGFPGMLGGGVGRLSGPAVHPLALECVWRVHEALSRMPIVGVGGIRSAADVWGMLLAGASAVQLGSVLLSDPAAPARILTDLRALPALQGYSRLADVVGAAHAPVAHAPEEERA